MKIVGDPASFIADRQAGMVTSIDTSKVGESERIGGGRRMGKGERTVSMGEKKDWQIWVPYLWMDGSLE